MAQVLNPMIFGGGGELKTVVLTKDGSGRATSDVLDTGASGEKQIVYMFAGIAEFTDAPNKFTLQGSDNNSSWTNVASWSCSVNKNYQGNPSSTSTITTEYRYFRATVNNNNGGCRSRALIVAVV